MLKRFCTALLAAVALPFVAAAQLTPAPPIQPPATSTLPKTGVDYSGIDQFYRVADILATDADPTGEQWREFLAAPGYILLWQQNRNIRQLMAVAFKPSRRAERDSLLKLDSDQVRALKHLLRAVEQREAVIRTRQALQRSIGDSIALGVRSAARFLPKGTVERVATPFIAFAVFGDDGYATDGGILIDPLYVKEEGLVELISHEFHHMYTATLDRTIGPTPGASPPYDVGLAGALRSLRNEGTADLIDKPHPLPPQTGALSWYPPRYNDVYGRTPVILQSIDSLLALVRDDSTKAAAAGQRARQLLWSNGHPNGAYMARTIVETFGVDSLMPGIYNFVAFARMYASAELKRGHAPPFSPKAMAMLDDMEKRYIRRP